MALTSPLTAQPTTATGAPRERWTKDSAAAVVRRGGSARVALTMTSATANRAAIVLNGVTASKLVLPIRSCPSARATNVPNM